MVRRSVSPNSNLQRRARVALACIAIAAALVVLPAQMEATNDDPFVTAPAKTSSAPVPEPASLLLFGSGLAGVAVLARRLRRKTR